MLRAIDHNSVVTHLVSIQMDGQGTLGQLAMIHTIGGSLDVWEYTENAHQESEQPITERDGTLLRVEDG